MNALASVAPVLRCPVCEEPVVVDGAALACGQGHRFDIARQGYVNLMTGRRGPGTGDSAAMVAARETFLARGHFAVLADAVAAAVGDDAAEGGLVLDVAGGTGYYLAALLDQRPDALGICVDLSTSALRRAARAHPRAAALAADAWGVLPIASGAASAVLSVFGPRNPAEIERVLASDGLLIVASPTPAHLGELIEPLGLLAVDPHKRERQAEAFSRFRPGARRTISYRVMLDHDDLQAVVGMGPSAVHIEADELSQRVRRMPEHIEVTVAVEVASYRR